MAVMRRLLSVGVVLVLLAASTRDAEAKLPSYILAGGELGPYSASFSSLPLVADGGLPGYLPSERDRVVVAPQRLPAIGYDLYPSYDLGVAHQLASGGPELRYYPELHLLHERRSDRWYELTPEAAAFLDAAIEDALAKKAAGELEEGPMAADFRARRLPEVAYWLKPYWTAHENFAAGPCEDCAGLTGSREEFIMRHLVETMSGPLRGPNGPTPELPPFALEYYGIVEPPYGGIGGRLGYYDPPTSDRPGRFWPGGYSGEALYYETTPGFDAFVAEAVGRASASPATLLTSAAAPDEGVSIGMMTVMSGLAAALVALGATAAVMFAWRRGGA